MKKVKVLIGIGVLAVLAGCAKKEAPQVEAAVDDEDISETATQAAPAPAPVPAPPAPQDRSKAAASMIASIDPGPQCQVYRDELEAKGKTAGPIKELSAIFIQAHDAGCGRNKQQ